MSEDRQIPTSAPADRPSFRILINGAQISGEFQVQGIVVMRDVNKVAMAQVMILDGDPATEDFKASNAEDFVPGNEIEIHAGYHSDDQLIFKGLIVRHGLSAKKNKPSLLRLECKDAAVKLTVARHDAYFYDVTDAEIIEQLAGDAGLEVDVSSDMISHPDLVQFRALDWDLIVARAEANGCLVVTDNGTLRVQPPDLSKEPALALAFGGNMLEFETVIDARYQFDAVTAHAWDAANQELLEVEAADPGADGPGNILPSDLAVVLGLDAYTVRHAGQLTETELQAWADAQLLKSRLAKIRGRVRVQGTSEVAPGDVVELSGVGERFTGNVFVSGVRHEINTENWETDIALGLDPEWFIPSTDDINGASAGGLLPAVSGLQIGLVTALEGDPDGEDRVQVRLPLIDASEEGVWARVACLDAGENRGTFFRPEVGDEVVLGFQGNDPRKPVLLGMLNSSAKPAPLPGSDDNHEKGIITRSEMMLLFNDDVNTITLETPSGNKVVLSEEDGGISLTDENDNKIILNADGITIESASDINMKASGDINIEGTNVSSAANGQFKAEGSGGAEMTSSATTVVKGSLVQIN
ncbi:MAG TPA: type VI secretion system tip protein VgrG [Rhodothermales bacterium]|nr:type VI secretion system tip protein VgrG [Rhodothermales bacterium]